MLWGEEKGWVPLSCDQQPLFLSGWGGRQATITTGCFKVGKALLIGWSFCGKRNTADLGKRGLFWFLFSLFFGFELRACVSYAGTFLLGYTSTPFCFTYFSHRASSFCQRPPGQRSSYLYLQVAGIMVVNYDTWPPLLILVLARQAPYCLSHTSSPPFIFKYCF
jgi:hypothetical protein